MAGWYLYRHLTLQTLFLGILLFLLLLPVGAFARKEDGSLDRILSPHNGQPAIVRTGMPFEVLLRDITSPAEVSCALIGADSVEYPLTVKSTADEQSIYARLECQPPEQMQPGGYTLRVTAPDGTTDTNTRAVWILDPEISEYYVLAHVTDVHIGKQRNNRPDPEKVFSAVIDEINKTDAALCAITGDITENADTEQFRRFLALLDRFSIPTLVCSGNHDRDNLQYERFMGLQTWVRTFGPDGFLVFDTKDYVVADDWGPQPGILHRLRRMLRPCRFTIGLTHRYEPAMGVRSQLVLFADDPIDLLLYGHTHQERCPGEGPYWAGDRVVITPACVDGYYRLIDITAQGPVPRSAARVSGIHLD